MHTYRWTTEQTGSSHNHFPHSIPVWIGFPGLRPHLFTPTALESLASAVGTFVRTNKDIHLFRRPGYARLCVEVDLLAPIHRIIFIRNGDELIRQLVVYENLPRFCTHCTLLGHTLHTCRQKATQTTTSTEEEYLPPLVYDDYIIAATPANHGRRPSERPPLGKPHVATSVHPIDVSSSTPRDTMTAKPLTAKMPLPTSQWVKKGAHKRPKTPPWARDSPSCKDKEKREYSVALLAEGTHYATFDVLYSPKPYLLTVVYATHRHPEQDALWEELAQHIHSHSQLVDLPWLIAGDFNCIRDVSERQGGRPPRLRSMQAFNDFIHESSLVEPPTIGEKWTWCNERQADSRTLMRVMDITRRVQLWLRRIHHLLPPRVGRSALACDLLHSIGIQVHVPSGDSAVRGKTSCGVVLA
ncbi:uncharacterized protein LOC144714813 [Wolffia australiana]